METGKRFSLYYRHFESKKDAYYSV